MRQQEPYHSFVMAPAKEVGPDINKLVADNIRNILGKRSPEAYCREKGKELFYVSGSKKGKRVAPRALRYAIDEEQSPRLDIVAAIAAKEDLQPYQLLFVELDPRNAPVVITKQQQQMIEGIQESFSALAQTGQFPTLRNP